MKAISYQSNQKYSTWALTPRIRCARMTVTSRFDGPRRCGHFPGTVGARDNSRAPTVVVIVLYARWSRDQHVFITTMGVFREINPSNFRACRSGLCRILQLGYLRLQ